MLCAQMHASISFWRRDRYLGNQSLYIAKVSIEFLEEAFFFVDHQRHGEPYSLASFWSKKRHLAFHTWREFDADTRASYSCHPYLPRKPNINIAPATR